MRRTFHIVAAIGAIGAIAVFAAPLFIATEDVRNNLFAQLESATGYRLRVSGPLSISVFPSLHLIANDVGVAQSAQTESGGKEIITAKEFRFGLAWSALIAGKARMTEIALVDPVIAAPAVASAQAQGEPTAEIEKRSLGEALKSLSLDSLIIKNGTIILPPSAGKQGKRFHGVNLTASMSGFESPVTFDLAMVLDGKPIAADGSVGALGAFLAGTPVPVALNVDAPAYLAQKAALAGKAYYAGNAFTLEQFTAKAGDSALTGSAAGDLAGEVPVIRAAFNGTLNLDALLPKSKEADRSAGNGDATPIDFSPLKAVNGDVNLSFSKIVVKGAAIAPLVAKARMGGGKLDLVAERIGVGNATGSGQVAVDANRDVPKVNGKIRIVGADVAAAGKMAGAELPVSGTAGADILFAAAGRSVAELQSSLNASGSLALTNGAATVDGLGAIVGDPKANRISGINAKASFGDLVKPVTVTGSASWHGEIFNLNATGDMRAFLADKSASFEAKATARRMAVGFKGAVSKNGQRSGRVSLQTASLTGLLRWLGQQPGWQSGFDAFAVDGNVTIAGDSISFDNTAFRLDNTQGTGSGKITLGKKPDIVAQLALDTLDVNPYLGAGGKSNSGGGGQAGWSDAKIDFSALSAIDAKLGLTAKQLIYGNIKTGAVSIQATIAGGKLDARLPTLELYKGNGAGALSIDASSGTPTQAFSFNLSNLDAYPFLEDAAGFQRVEGEGALAIDVKAKGASQRAIGSTLSGTAKFTFTNGAIRGVNIAKMARNLTANVLSGWGDNAGEKTDFAMLGANFTIAQGVAETSDLQLVGPFVRMTGSGRVDMPAQTLEFKVDPKVVASLEGQGGKADLEGLGVPVVVSGPWDRPKIYPDMAGILQNPTAAYDRLRRVGGGLFKLPEGGAAGALGKALGGVAAGPVGPGGASARDAIGGAIGAILGDGNVDPAALGAMKGASQAPKKKQQAAPMPVNSAAGMVDGATQAPKPKERALPNSAQVDPNQKPTSDATETDKKKAKETPSKTDAAVNQNRDVKPAMQGGGAQTDASTGARAKPKPKSDAEQLMDLLGG